MWAPVGVGGEPARRQVRETPVGEIGKDLFDDGVAVVGQLGVHCGCTPESTRWAAVACVEPMRPAGPARARRDRDGFGARGVTNPAGSACPARPIARTGPPHDTIFASPHTTSATRRVSSSRTCATPSRPGGGSLNNSHPSSSEGIPHTLSLRRAAAGRQIGAERSKDNR
ncbi:hypothetical protein GCM10010399_01950 [Dactylosporangium fulvum]